MSGEIYTVRRTLGIMSVSRNWITVGDGIKVLRLDGLFMVEELIDLCSLKERKIQSKLRLRVGDEDIESP